MTKQRNFFEVPKLNRDGTTSNSRVGLVLLICTVLAMTACSSRNVISTSDDSAEYKTARALAPLKKSINDESVVVEKTPDIVLPEPVRESDSKEVAAERGPVDKMAVSRTVDIDMSATVKQNEEKITEQQSAVGESPMEAALLTEGDAVKLMLSSGIDGAWGYLIEKLEGSEITVFSRNKSAGRIAIGCAEIGNEIEVVRAGRWSIFNRKVNSTYEYCALKAVERKGFTAVSVLDRAGQEASADDSRLIFNRILK